MTERANMSLATTMDGMNYEDMPLKKSKKKDLMVFSEMSTWKIIRKVSYRHRIGLWTSAAIIGWSLQLNIPHYVIFWYGVFFN
jgi:hypothetical protein